MKLEAPLGRQSSEQICCPGPLHLSSTWRVPRVTMALSTQLTHSLGRRCKPRRRVPWLLMGRPPPKTSCFPQVQLSG